MRLTKHQQVASFIKASEVIEFVRRCSAARPIPTHDAVLSPTGKEIYDRIVSSYLSMRGATDASRREHRSISLRHQSTPRYRKLDKSSNQLIY